MTLLLAHSIAPSYITLQLQNSGYLEKKEPLRTVLHEVSRETIYADSERTGFRVNNWFVGFLMCSIFSFLGQRIRQHLAAAGN
jgi:hypothetical protein